MRLLNAALALAAATAAPPSVIFHVVVDDLGWGDTSYHAPASGPRDAGISTPHMAALAAEGVLLDRLYVYHMCTPSRSSFLSGRLPVHVEVALPNPEDPNQGVPRNMTTVAARLRRAPAGYQTHVVGKWDLGMATFDHTPLGRGFDSSLIYYEHKVDYWTQQLAQSSCSAYGTIVDLWSHSPTQPEGPARALNGTAYVEYLFRDRVLEIIAAHDPAKGPLYLQYDPHIAHCPLQVPADWLARFTADNDEAACQAQTASVFPGSGPGDYRCRNIYHAMVALLDEVLGNVTDALKARGLWEDTLMVLHSDNGGPVDVTESGSNNWPLRGGKYSRFEGGVRANAFASGGYLPPAVRGTVNAGIMHVADWSTTYCMLAGGSEAECTGDARAAASGLPPVDGLNLWPLLSGATQTSPRVEVPIDIHGPSQALIQGDYKLLLGQQIISGWEGPVYPNASSVKNTPYVNLACGTGCLYNVVTDPTEQTDLASAHPDIVAAMTARLHALAPTFYSNNETGVDSPLCSGKPKGMPCGCFLALPGNRWNGYFGPYQV